MDYKKKTDLINSLAEHMGLQDVHNTKYSMSRYDASTGTLYCEGMTLPHSSLERVKTWYKMQMLTFRDMFSRDESLKEMYINYAVAYNALCMLEDNLND